jgi:cell division septation protein DedD
MNRVCSFDSLWDLPIYTQFNLNKEVVMLHLKSNKITLPLCVCVISMLITPAIVSAATSTGEIAALRASEQKAALAKKAAEREAKKAAAQAQKAAEIPAPAAQPTTATETPAAPAEEKKDAVEAPAALEEKK